MRQQFKYRIFIGGRVISRHRYVPGKASAAIVAAYNANPVRYPTQGKNDR